MELAHTATVMVRVPPATWTTAITAEMATIRIPVWSVRLISTSTAMERAWTVELRIVMCVRMAVPPAILALRDTYMIALPVLVLVALIIVRRARLPECAANANLDTSSIGVTSALRAVITVRFAWMKLSVSLAKMDT